MAVRRPWPGLTANGNLSHKAIRHVENAITEAEAARECLAEMQAQMLSLIGRQDQCWRRCWLALGDLRYMREPSSSWRLDQRARAMRAKEHLQYGEERDRL